MIHYEIHHLLYETLLQSRSKYLLLKRILVHDSFCNLDDCPFCLISIYCNDIPPQKRREYSIKVFKEMYGEEELFEVLL